MLTEEEGKALLKKTYDALLPGGMIIVQEFSPLDENAKKSSPTQIHGKLMDLFLMTFTAGCDRSKKDMITWIEDAGFLDLKLVSLPNGTTLMIAEKPM